MRSRREILQLTAAFALQAAPAPELEELTITQLQEGLVTSRWTAVQLVEKYLARIDEIDKHGPRINSVIELNPEAAAIAAALDRERKDKGVRGPLHGIPILIKDNIETGDKMMTSAGSLALAGAPVSKDAELVTRLRAAGAVILGKTNLSEWANFRSSHSTSGWSGRGGADGSFRRRRCADAGRDGRRIVRSGARCERAERRAHRRRTAGFRIQR